MCTYFSKSYKTFQFLGLKGLPSLTNRPDVADTGRAVRAVLGVANAAPIVGGLPAIVPGRDTPLIGRPDWLVGRNA